MLFVAETTTYQSILLKTFFLVRHKLRPEARRIRTPCFSITSCPSRQTSSSSCHLGRSSSTRSQTTIM